MSRESRNHIMEFVKFQREILRKITPSDMQDYYATDDDIENIKEWDKNICDKILNDILIFVFDQEVASIDWSTNPFCQYNNVRCKNCLYGKIHGMCDDKNSNRRSLQRFFRNTNIDEFSALSNKVYRKFFTNRGLKLKKHKDKNNE